MISKLGGKGNQPIADSLRSHALISYLRKFSYLFSKPPIDQFKVCQYITEMCCVYHHLRDQILSKKDKPYDRASKPNMDLSNVSIMAHSCGDAMQYH